MIILGIETSCDETAAAVIKDGTRILSNVVASSVELHKKTGGIIPEVAAREQIKCIVPVIEESLKEAKVQSFKEIDSIAVTHGPGLVGSLLVGVETAKTLAWVWEKPIIPVNHLQAHLYANWLATEDKKLKTENRLPKFPAIGLVVSGGHTDLVLMKGHATPATLARSSGGQGNLKWLGGTRDDAAGECFDKTARVLGLGYPGGPAIAAEAEKLDPRRYTLDAKLPRPMIKEDNFDFSFSGLKTAVTNLTKNLKLKTKNKSLESSVISALAFEIQEAITDVLVEKTIRAARKYQVKSILLAGGVAANSRLREKFHSQLSLPSRQAGIVNSPFKFWCPPPKLCTDNATYIATCAYFNPKFVPWKKIKVDPSLRIC
jgi:N6-L-threonylcarbamoyladenine synthase